MFIPQIEESLHEQEMTVVLFQNECSMSEIERVQHIVEETNSEVIVGVGGGKVLDTTKACVIMRKSLLSLYLLQQVQMPHVLLYQ